MDGIFMDGDVIEFGAIAGSVIRTEPIGGTDRHEAVDTLTGRVVIIKPEGGMLFTAYESMDLEMAEEIEATPTEIPGLLRLPMKDIIRALDIDAYVRSVKEGKVAPQDVPASMLRDVLDQLRMDVHQRDRQIMERRQSGQFDPEGIRHWQSTTTIFRVAIEDLERRVA